MRKRWKWTAAAAMIAAGLLFGVPAVAEAEEIEAGAEIVSEVGEETQQEVELAPAEVYAASGWRFFENQWYYYVDGSPVTGWQAIKGKWYFFDASCAMQTGFIADKGKWYYLNDQGVLQTGWRTIEGKVYFFTSSGVMRTGWYAEKGKWYLLSDKGVLQIGWKAVGGKWYYFGDDGAMRTGWQEIAGKWYLFNGSGAMRTGWTIDKEKWYYLRSDGAMQTGWAAIAGKWYYFDEAGKMRTGWEKIDEKWYVFDENGVMQTGWVLNRDVWFHFSDKGVMQTGWVAEDGEWYYFDEDGEMVTGNRTIGGKKERFAVDGKWLRPVEETEEEEQQSGFIYDAATAIEFAKTHTARDVELGLPRDQCENGWLCAEFLSNCLRKGGMTEYSDHATILHAQLAEDPKVQEIVVPLDNGYIKLENVKGGELAAGDGILLYCDSCTDGRPFVHSLFFVGWDENGYAKIYCHNNRNVGVVNRWPACYACHARLKEGHAMHIISNSPKKNNTYPKNTLMKVGGKRMYINEKGWKTYGWQQVDDDWYYFGSDAYAVKGWQKIDGKWYYFDDDYKMQTGLQTIGDDTYFFLYGAMQTGWAKRANSWFYFEANGVMVTGEKTIGGKTYVFDEDGVCTNR